MAQDQREEIKQKINLTELISEYLPLRKAGRNFKALCPFHSETAPSFIVSPERQIWKCFGCGESGDHFGFLMRMEGLEFGEALRTLAKRAGVKLEDYRPSESEKAKQVLYEINHLAAEFYHYLLLNHPVGKKALNYLQGRGIQKESLALFRLGYAPDHWDTLQKYLVAKKGYRAEDLEKAGLVIKREKKPGFYDRFRGRLIFPLKDHRNNVAGFSGRVLEAKVKEAKYVNTPETLIYHKSDLLYGLTENKETIKKAEAAVLTEGELDVISSCQVGVKNAVAIKGSALSETQVNLLNRFTQNLIFALDRDVAGDKAAWRGIEVAEAAGMVITVVLLKGGKDPDEVAQKKPELWKKLVKEAVPVYDYYLDSVLARFDRRTAEGKRKISQTLVPVLAQISDEIVKAHYVKKLAEKLNVEQTAILAQMEKVFRRTASDRSQITTAVFPKETEKTPREKLEEYLLALAFQTKQWPFLKKKKVVQLVKTPRFIRILTVLVKYLKKKRKFESERLAKALPAELKTTFDHFYLLNLGNLAEDETKTVREIEKVLLRLEETDLREKLKEVSTQIRELEKKEKKTTVEKKQLTRLDQKFRDLSGHLAELDSKT